MIYKTVLGVAVAMSMAGCGGASDPCLGGEAEVKELLAEKFPIEAEQRAKLDGITAAATALKAGGKTTECGQAWDEAIAILKQAQDADMFNKSE